MHEFSYNKHWLIHHHPPPPPKEMTKFDLTTNPTHIKDKLMSQFSDMFTADLRHVPVSVLTKMAE